MNTSPPATRTLLSLQYARAIAALCVVFAHLSNFEIPHRANLREFGGMGVDIFFVISGFIIAETSDRQRSGVFVGRRLIRIVPAYWFYTLALVCVAATAPSMAPHIHIAARSVIFSLFFIPYLDHQGNLNPILLQGWSLNYEMFFYLVFAIALLLKRRTNQLLFVVAVIMTLIVIGAIHTFSQAVARVYTDSMMIEFLLGVVLSKTLVVRSYSRLIHGISLTIGVLALCALEVCWQINTYRAFTYGAAALLFLFGLIGFEPFFRRNPLIFLRRVGDASYSLYLSHPFVLSVLALLFRRLSISHNVYASYGEAVIYIILALIVTSVFACLSLKFVEIPSAAVLNKLSKRYSNSRNQSKGGDVQ